MQNDQGIAELKETIRAVSNLATRMDAEIEAFIKKIGMLGLSNSFSITITNEQTALHIVGRKVNLTIEGIEWEECTTTTRLKVYKALPNLLQGLKTEVGGLLHSLESTSLGTK